MADRKNTPRIASWREWPPPTPSFPSISRNLVLGRTAVAFVAALAIGAGELGVAPPTPTVAQVAAHNMTFRPPVSLGSLSPGGHPTLTVNLDGSGTFGVVLADR